MAFVTVKEVAEAMIADPTKKVQGELIDYTEDTEGEYNYHNWEVARNITDPKRQVLSCAIGGAALILEVDEEDLMTALGGVDRDGVKPRRGADLDPYDEGDMQSLSRVITDLNDNSSTSKAAIGKRILAQADEKTLNTRLRVAKKKRSFKVERKAVPA